MSEAVTSRESAPEKREGNRGGDATRPRPRQAARAGFAKLRASEADLGARRLCALILEVLGGVRTPTDAAGNLKVSLPRYYALETRALEGLLDACRPRARGPRRTAEREAAGLRREVERLERERGRLQALVRTTERAAGLSPPASSKPLDSSGRKRRKRKPAVRALRAAKAILPSVNPLDARGEAKEDATLVKG